MQFVNKAVKLKNSQMIGFQIYNCIVRRCNSCDDKEWFFNNINNYRATCIVGEIGYSEVWRL
jgi:hypothetical protein